MREGLERAYKRSMACRLLGLRGQGAGLPRVQVDRQAGR